MALDWNISDGSFKGVQFHVAISKPDAPYGVQSQTITTERRVQISERPMVDGADVEDFGKKPRTFEAEVIFFGANYDAELKAFEDKLNEGSSGQLILPDLQDAVWAKFQRATRRTTAAEGNSTVLTVSWIEDNTTTQLLVNPLRDVKAAIDAKKAGDIASAAPTIFDKANNVLAKIAAVSAAISQNNYLSVLSNAENAVTNARVALNGVLNLPANLKAQILSTYNRVNMELQTLGASVNGIVNYSSVLKDALKVGSPTRFNTGLGSIDYLAPDTASTTTVSGTSQVVQKVTAVTPIQSFPEGVAALKASVAGIQDASAKMEDQTGGAVPELTKGAIDIVNATRDLIAIIDEPAPTPILVTSNASLLEIAFRNGIDISEIDRLYSLNSSLDDILDVPAGTVIYL